MSDFDWEDTALRLLEMNLNGESLNAEGLNDLFSTNPAILRELDITGDDGASIDNLDAALYGGMPKVIEIRELKPTQVHHCKACNRSFKRADNFRRHLATSLHQRRQKAWELSQQIAQEEKLDKQVKAAVV